MRKPNKKQQRHQMAKAAKRKRNDKKRRIKRQNAINERNNIIEAKKEEALEMFKEILYKQFEEQNRG